MSFINSLPKIRMTFGRHTAVAGGAIGLAVVSMGAYAVGAPGYVDVNALTNDQPERIQVAQVAPFGMAERKPVPVPDAEPAAGETAVADAAAEAPAAAPGADVFNLRCMACHGPTGEGVQGLAPALAGSAYVSGKSTDELVAFLKVGRMPNDPESVQQGVMPGFAYLSEEELAQVSEYIKNSL